jgi:1,4-alpha-glucan branching enzyme
MGSSARALVAANMVHLVALDDRYGCGSSLYQRFVAHPTAVHQLDADAAGFSWMDCDDWAQSVVSFGRFAADRNDLVVCVANFTPVVREGYRVGVPRPGYYAELINTDGVCYGGTDVGNGGGVMSEPVPWHGQPHSVLLTLPPLAALWLRPAP